MSYHFRAGSFPAYDYHQFQPSDTRDRRQGEEMRTRVIFLLVVGGVVSGCGHLAPNIKDLEVVADRPTTIENFAIASEKTILQYRAKIAKQEEREWDTGSANLIGGSIGAIGAVAQSIPVAGAGALTVGVSTLVSSFYGVEKQNDAYTSAYVSTKCLRELALNLDSPAMEFVIAPSGGGDATTYALKLLNAGMYRMEDKLFARLRKRAVSTAPDFVQFQSYLKMGLASAKAPMAGVDKSKSVAFIFKSDGTQTTISKEELERVQIAVGRLEADVGVCVSAS
ncbi:hypothetical protein JFT81_08420 [Pseudomonas sp. TH43]|uniref:hypothetical protein n=1 Tax=Pseudomonas sp. TH43 TaxID=2796407 RepID=UPI001913D41E|nr:hypothetical protein [Pseudomonas sp. TH43]MBK5374657.1 hypothetical protein [Pseudomonas sp. TH43]